MKKELADKAFEMLREAFPDNEEEDFFKEEVDGRLYLREIYQEDFKNYYNTLEDKTDLTQD